MKIAFDTNIILRMLVLDDQVKVKKIVNLIDEHEKKDIFVCSIVLIEAYHVSTKVYNISKDKVLDFFEDLLKIDRFFLEHDSALRQAVIKSKKGFEFNDALIGEIAAAKNVKTLTFDQGLKGNSSFEIL